MLNTLFQNFIFIQCYYEKKVNFGHTIPFITTRGKMESCKGIHSCERYTLSPSIDEHLSNVSIFLMTKDITKRKLILDMQFPFQLVGMK